MQLFRDMRKIPLALFTGVVIYIAATLFSSCKHGCGRDGGTSTAGSKESHNVGLNCLNCHSGNGDGEGCFNVGGTAFMDDLTTAFPGCDISLYTAAEGKGELVISLKADGKGNFYTGKSINWGNGLYPTITSPAGNKENMLEPIKTGACNSCHGVTTDRVYIY